MKKLFVYLQQVQAELKLVTWPTRQEIIRMTTIVIVSSVVVGIYLSGLDFLFTKLLGFIIG